MISKLLLVRSTKSSVLSKSSKQRFLSTDIKRVAVVGLGLMGHGYYYM